MGDEIWAVAVTVTPINLRRDGNPPAPPEGRYPTGLVALCRVS